MTIRKLFAIISRTIDHRPRYRQNINQGEKGKTTMKTTTEKTTATVTTFADLLRTYEQYANNPDADPTAKPLTDLATATTFSVLKKCINVSANPTLTQVRRDLARDLHNLFRIAYAGEHATETRYNADGDPYTAIVDKDCYTALTTLTSETFGDGIDLVHDAIVCILTETEKARDRNGGTLPPAFMETAYSIRRLNRKVWIKTAESVNGWETTDTTAIQETYKAVRRAVDNGRAVQTDPRNGYTYLADISTDPESGIGETIYRRFGKYADIGGAVTDINGKETAYTADEQTARDTDTIIESLNLTAKQAKVLQLRQSGYGYKAIATYLGVTQRAVAKTVEAIQTKAVAIGLTPAK